MMAKQIQIHAQQNNNNGTDNNEILLMHINNIRPGVLHGPILPRVVGAAYRLWAPRDGVCMRQLTINILLYYY